MKYEKEQQCPICKKEVTPSSRYPNYICQDCRALATDEDGNPVSYSNTSLIGSGCKGEYRRTGETYNKNICYVKEVKCKAREAYLGGVVIEPLDMR